MSRSSWSSRLFLSGALAVAVVGALAVATPTQAHAATNVVTDGHARFEVLTPTLIRLEYAGDDAFQDNATFNAIGRNMPVPAFTTTVTGGVREIRTAGMTLRYRQGGGPFTSANTSVQLTGTGTTGAPAFPSYCAFGTACQAENGLFGGDASAAYDHQGYTGSGFLAGFTKQGSSLIQDISGVPAAGTYQLTVRYANSAGGDGQNVTRTLSSSVDGRAGPTLSLPVTGSWDTWSTASVTLTVGAGTHTIRIGQDAGFSGNVNVDSIALTSTGAGFPAADQSLLTTAYGAGPSNSLGGWDRSLDNPEAVPTPEHPGILNRDGWYLLDDTRTALLNGDHTITDRPSHGTQPYQDGYLFGYGQNFKQALADLNALTGGADLLPQSAYGVWYSRYFAYTTSDYQNTLLPAFRSTFTPIDWLVVDTDWKAPSTWNGWNWNPALFPDPQGFMNWTRQQGLSVSLNIHPSIAGDDPKFATANQQAGGLPADGNNQYRWDWTNPAHLRSYLNVQDSFEQQGVREWWLDYCTGCGGSRAGDPHVAADNFINQAYADDATARGLRGFSFARVGGAEQGGIHSNYPVGPWSERRNTMQFTGDTPMTWDMLAFEARFTPDEAAAGLSNVSHDIGSFHGGHLPDDMYARWVQLGAFQPVLRLHSDHGDRLPWNYTGAAATSAERFLRLRESLVPYTYTLAQQANKTGVPITQPLYLNYPSNADAYTHPQEYLYGDNVLVAPITSSSGSVSAWIPPGTWTNYFTGTTYTGPQNVTLSAPLTEMPVLIKSGGILPTRTDYVENQQQPLAQLTLTVGAGANGSFSLYQDAGEGNGYKSGQSTSTPVTWNDASRTLTVGATSGSYPGAATARAYTLRLTNAAAPTAVFVDGTQVPETAWSYNSNSRTVTVTTAQLPVGSAHTVSLSGNATGNPQTGEVTGPGGLCVDVSGSDPASGTAIQLYGCNQSDAQRWSVPGDGSVRVLGKCLDVAHGATANRTQVQLWDCNASGSQTWVSQANGTLLNPQSGRCLDDPDGAAKAGDHLQIYDCNTSAAQQFRLGT